MTWIAPEHLSICFRMTNNKNHDHKVHHGLRELANDPLAIVIYRFCITIFTLDFLLGWKQISIKAHVFSWPVKKPICTKDEFSRRQNVEASTWIQISWIILFFQVFPLKMIPCARRKAKNAFFFYQDEWRVMGASNSVKMRLKPPSNWNHGCKSYERIWWWLHWAALSLIVS